MTDTQPIADARTTTTLTARDGRLWRDGREYRLLSGSVHYFRVHPAQWQDRLRRLAAVGANAVDTYVPWNFHERVEGAPDFDGWRDIETFIRLAGDVGLDVLLRPSPYICAEWSAGGIPTWLSARTTALRSSDPVFLAAVDRWYDALLPRIAPLQAVHGGPIIAVQVENEYGSFGSDAAYLAHLRDALRSHGIVELLTTADGTEADMHRQGGVEGVAPTFTFGSGVSRAVAIKDPETPLVCGELWGGWFDHWGENHHVRSVESMMGTLDELLGAGGSVSLYMAHGGTNFGLWNGSNHFGVLQPTITSYDSDAPISEDGRVNAKFAAIRDAFAPFHEHDLPALPADPVFLPTATVPLRGHTGLLAAVRSLPALGGPTPQPQTFEALGVDDGAVAYRATVDLPADAVITIPQLHDRATVFVDDTRVGTLERDGDISLTVPGDARIAEVTIIVESLGRINYGALLGEHKGILAGVLVGRRFAHGWTHHVLPQDAWTASVVADADAAVGDGLATATVRVDAPADAWLAFPGGGRGWVWLNGFLLGRYWQRGPQVTLYAPAPLWREGDNEIRVLDFDHLGDRVEVRDEPELGPVEEFIGS